MEEIQEKYIINGKELTLEEFNQEKNKLLEKKIKLVEVSKNEYKTRLED